MKKTIFEKKVMAYSKLKSEIKAEIYRQNETVKEFISKNPQLGLSESGICNRLNPKTNVTLGKLEPIIEAVGLKLCLRRA